MGFDEAVADRALFRVATPDGATLGTGFLASPDGVVVTCDHVVSGQAEVRLESPAGRSATVTGEDMTTIEALDLALLHCPSLAGDALPLAAGFELPLPYWTKGYHHLGSEIRAALPGVGTATGTTRVAYDDYDIDGVLALHEGHVDLGLSGAPVIDSRWGVVVAVVNASLALPDIGGIALPLGLAAEQSDAIADLLERNDALVARHGQYMNAAGAREVCSRILAEELEFLDASALLLPDRYCARSAASAGVASFVGGAAKVLAMVGRSGVGKTTELAHIATDQLGAEAGVLVAVASLPPATNESLQRTLAARFDSAGADLDRVLGALSVEGRDLYVLVDALNEAPQPLQQAFPQWIARTIKWVRERNVRMIVTCRTEHWETIRRWFPDDLLGSGSLGMEDFTDEEAAAALEAYQLADGTLDPHDVRHPFLARIYWELSASGDDPVRPLSRFEAIERFIRARCERIALPLALPAASVEAVLLEAAHATLDRADMVLDREAFTALSSRHPQVAARLVSDNLLLESGETFHFMFDEVGEFLQAHYVSADELARPELVRAIVGGTESRRLTTLSFALLRIERRDGSEALVRALEPFVAGFEESGSFWLEVLLQRVATSAVEPRALMPLLMRYARASVESEQPYDYLAERIAQEIRLPARERFEFVQVLARHEHYYDWEWHHWHSYVGSDEWTDMIGALVDEVRADPVGSFRILIGWLDDSSPLRESPSDPVANVAAGLIWRFSDLAFDELCELLVASEQDTMRLLDEIGTRNPARMIERCEAWAGERGDRQVAAARHSRTLAKEVGDADVRRRASDVLRRVALEPSSDEARTEALTGLMAREETRGEAIDAIVERLLARDPVFTPYALLPALSSHLPQVIDALIAYLEGGGPDLGGAIHILTRAERADPRQYDRMVDELERLLAAGASTYELALGVEALLSRTRGMPDLGDRLLSLAERLLGGDATPGQRNAFVIYAMRNGDADPDRRKAVVDLVVRTAVDDHDVLALFDKAHGDDEAYRVALDAITDYDPRDPDDFERRLIGAAGIYSGREADQIAEVYRPRGQSGRRFERMISAGLSPHDAAHAIAYGEPE